MTTSRSLVRLGYALSAIVVIGAAASDIEAEPTRPLSHRALAGLEPLQVGQAFLRLGERVGIVLRTDDRDTSYQLPGGVAAPDTARTLEALEALTASNPHYRLDRGPKGVLRLTPKQYGRCAAYL